MANNITQHIANTVSNTGVRTAYGEAVEVDGATILPVAVGSYGFAAGEGGGGTDGADAGDASGDASGGGGTALSLPIGAYITRDGHTRFEPNIIALLTVGVPFVCVAGRAVARIIRALKR